VSLDEPISKSQRKREMHDLQALGEALSQLSQDKIKHLALPETLEKALLDIKTFKAHGAVRRQLQYIGKLMRDVDPEPLIAYLDQLKGVSKEAVALQHLAEQWRLKIIEDIRQLDQFCEAHPQADRTQLRQLAMNAHKEQQAQKPPRSFRQLYRLIFEQLTQHTTQSDHDDQN
jgi:ribosome-associated protein